MSSWQMSRGYETGCELLRVDLIIAPETFASGFTISYYLLLISTMIWYEEVEQVPSDLVYEKSNNWSRCLFKITVNHWQSQELTQVRQPWQAWCCNLSYSTWRLRYKDCRFKTSLENLMRPFCKLKQWKREGHSPVVEHSPRMWKP